MFKYIQRNWVFATNLYVFCVCTKHDNLWIVLNVIFHIFIHCSIPKRKYKITIKSIRYCFVILKKAFYLEANTSKNAAIHFKNNITREDDLYLQLSRSNHVKRDTLYLKRYELRNKHYNICLFLDLWLVSTFLRIMKLSAM